MYIFLDSFGNIIIIAQRHYNLYYHQLKLNLVHDYFLCSHAKTEQSKTNGFKTVTIITASNTEFTQY